MIRRVCKELLLLLLLIVSCIGCTAQGNNAPPASPVTVFSNAQIIVETGALTFGGRLSRGEDGISTLVVTSPDTVFGITFTSAENTISFMGLSCECLAERGAVQGLFEVLRTANLTVKSGEGFCGVLQNGDTFVIITDNSGLITLIRFPGTTICF